MTTSLRCLTLMACSLSAGCLALVAAAQPAAAENPVYVMQTSMGEITIEIFADKAPITARNFADYVEADYYDGTIFHRVIADFMIQGGGFTADMQQKPTKRPIKNEADNGLKNDKYTLAMARGGDPNSATSQFFINVSDNGFLNREQSRDGYGYAVFGKVIDGKGVVDKIRQVPTRTVPAVPEPMENVPVKPVVIEKVELKKPESKQ